MSKLADAFSSPELKRRHVRRLFSTIADRYDLITVLLSVSTNQRLGEIAQRGFDRRPVLFLLGGELEPGLEAGNARVGDAASVLDGHIGALAALHHARRAYELSPDEENQLQTVAKSVVLKDVPDNGFVLGNPARVIGYNQAPEEMES